MSLVVWAAQGGRPPEAYRRTYPIGSRGSGHAPRQRRLHLLRRAVVNGLVNAALLAEVRGRVGRFAQAQALTFVEIEWPAILVQERQAVSAVGGRSG